MAIRNRINWVYNALPLSYSAIFVFCTKVYHVHHGIVYGVESDSITKFVLPSRTDFEFRYNIGANLQSTTSQKFHNHINFDFIEKNIHFAYC